jgi:hypothetical protein
MQPINRILLILLVAAGAFFYWLKQQSKGEYDRQVGALAATLDRRSLSPAMPAGQAEGMFLRAIVIFSDFRTLVSRGRINTGEETYLNDVLLAAGYESQGEIQLVSRTLRDSLNLCQQMKITSEAEGTKALLNGQPPVIRAGSFKGDNLVIARRVSAALAPELANHPANLALVPSSVAALIWPLTLSDGTMAAVNEFKAHNLLDPKTVLDLKQRLEQVKATRQ